MEEMFTGCLEDTRSEEAKAKDWHKDLAMAGPVNWVEKSFEDIAKFPIRNQDGSYSCVAQTLALIMGIENFLEEKPIIVSKELSVVKYIPKIFDDSKVNEILWII
jgi:hypothetical protein